MSTHLYPLEKLFKIKNRKVKSQCEMKQSTISLQHKLSQSIGDIKQKEAIQLKKKHHNMKTIQKSLIKVIHHRKQNKNNKLNEKHHENVYRLNEKINLLNNDKINSHLIDSLKYCQNLPNYESLCQDYTKTENYQKIEEIYQTINSLMISLKLIQPNYTENELLGEFQHIKISDNSKEDDDCELSISTVESMVHTRSSKQLEEEDLKALINWAN
ncbi:hypothetical protein MN116_008371 [Schistosoma mekongi]|uniref:Uncharacterized protein n=1 Tax=Schistosoma mekongi TaxID=38744 RepID=A0AAE1Z6D7_SCHME|nr:hypothetical protein MN116_008371 [Schistosoma mekongi]